MDSSNGEGWKQEAEISINQVEAVIVFDPNSCDESENAKWEIEKVRGIGLEILELTQDGDNSIFISRLKSLYDLEEEFNNCFSSDKKDSFELYKLMIESSESLIQRRQKTNAFFITAIGSLLAIAGLLIKTGTIVSESIWILYGFSIVGLLLLDSAVFRS